MASSFMFPCAYLAIVTGFFSVFKEHPRRQGSQDQDLNKLQHSNTNVLFSLLRFPLEFAHSKGDLRLPGVSQGGRVVRRSVILI